jgi:2'-5' RNA ligase
MSLPAEYSIWLRPAAQDEAVLINTVAHLADLRGGYRFAPHVTVQGDLAQPLEGLRGMLAPLARKIPQQRWQVEAVEASPHFFRCMVLRFAPCAAFKGMQAAAQAFSQTEQGLSPFPHLSLAYGDAHPDNVRLCQELADEYVGREMVLDRLSICHSSKSVPIPNWRYLADYPLVG